MYSSCPEFEGDEVMTGSRTLLLSMSRSLSSVIRKGQFYSPLFASEP